MTLGGSTFTLGPLTTQPVKPDISTTTLTKTEQTRIVFPFLRTNRVSLVLNPQNVQLGSFQPNHHGDDNDVFAAYTFYDSACPDDNDALQPLLLLVLVVL